METIQELKTSFTSNVKKIYHMADIHIRLNNERYKEYRDVFNKLYNKIKEDDPKDSIIVLCGDILHSKNELSPECVDLTIEFIKSLSSICDLIMIMGNHDGNLSNKTKLDSLSPIIREIKSTYHIHYLLYSGIYKYNNIYFGVSSLMDNKFISADDFNGFKLDKNCLKMALYHGPLHQSETDVGYRMNNEEFTVDKFKGYDYVLLGDIHRFQYLNKEKTICYPSSLIQQNYGESIDRHGIVKWNLVEKNSEFIKIPNDYGYCCLNVNQGKLNIKDKIIPNNPRIKLIIKDTDGVTIKEIINKLKKKYNVNEITFSLVNNQNGTLITNKETQTSKDKPEIYQNLQNVDYQNKLMKEYMMKNMKLTSEEMDIIIEINQKLNKDIKNSINITNKWKLLNMDFSNMFCYGTNNEINFTKINGIVGLFAPNYSGKSSIVDILLFTLFDKCSRGLRTDILNDRKNQFHCRVTIEVDGCEYVIMRVGKFPKKNAKNIKIDVFFWKKKSENDQDDKENNDNEDEYILLNGIDRNDTNKIITNLIGTYDDFVMTSFCLQKEISFIDHPQSKKKDFLIKMLKLNIFEKLLENAKAENKVKMIQLKELMGKTKDLDISELKNNLIAHQNEKKEIEEKVGKINILIEKYHLKNEFHNKKLIDISDQNYKKIEQINHEINKTNQQLNEFKSKLNQINKNNEIKESELKKLKENLSNFNQENINQTHKNFIEDQKLEIDNLTNKLKQLYNKKKPIKTFEKTLEQYTNEKKKLEENIKNDQSNMTTLEDEVNNLKNKIIEEAHFDNIKELYDKYSKLKNKFDKNNIQLDKINDQITIYKEKLEKLNKHEYDPNCKFCMNNIFVKDAIETKNKLKQIEKEQSKILETMEPIEKKLGFKKYKNIEDKFNNLKKLSDQNNKINASIKDSIHKKEILKNNIELKKNNITNIDKIIQEYQDEEKNIIFNKELEMEIETIENQIDITKNKEDQQYNEMIEIKNKISEIETSLSNVHKLKLENQINELTHKHKILLDSKNDAENYEKIKQNNDNILSEINKIKKNIKDANNELNKLYQDKEELVEKICYIKKEIEIYESHKKDIQLLEKETKSYQNYCKIVGKDGLPYVLLNNLIPLLEEGANKIILPLTTFSIHIEQHDDNNINIYKVVGDKKLNIELCSGFEKFIVGLAIRISLINLSKLSSCNFMLIDEGFSCMDNNNINNLTSLFNTLNDMFDFIIVISHLDSIKSQCDNYITIDKNKGGFSKIIYK